MKRFLLLLSLMFAISALAQTNPIQPESVSVSGIGRVSVAPDRYSFNVGVQTLATTVDDALRENNTRVAAVVAALKKAGAQDKEIRTSNFSIYPQQDYQQGRSPRITGYQVNNSVTVTRDKVGDAGKLLQAAVSAGVNVSSGLNFEVSDPTKGRDEGMRAAFNDAKAKASVLANAAGRTLGRALWISEGGAQAPQPMPKVMAMRAEMAQQSEVPVESGTQELVFGVSVTFELR
jgi:uncharacterized protein YggE